MSDELYEEEIGNLRAERNRLRIKLDSTLEELRRVSADNAALRERLAAIDASIPDSWYGGAFTHVRVAALVKQEGYRTRVDAELARLRAEIQHYDGSEPNAENVVTFAYDAIKAAAERLGLERREVTDDRTN